MLNHERFRRLTALGSIGQLSADEYREIDAHLTDCVECRAAQEDYSRVIYHELPKISPTRWRNRAAFRPLSDDSRRDRFLARALAEGIEFSRGVEQPRAAKTLPFVSMWHRRLALACSALVVISFTGLLLGREYRFAPPWAALKHVPSDQMPREAKPQTQIPMTAQISEPRTTVQHGVRAKNSPSAESIRRLQRDLESAQTRAAKLSAELSQLVSEKADLQEIDEPKDGGLPQNCCSRPSKREFTWSENRSWQ